MTTRLESEVVRETFLTVDGREVEVALLPMNVERVEPESIRFRLKGTRSEEFTKVVPMNVLLRALGWKVRLGDAIRPAVPKSRAVENAEVEQLIADLEATFGRAAS